MQNYIIMFIHVMAAGVCVGSSVYCLFLVIPELLKSEDENSTAIKLMDALVPTIFTSVALLAASGIYYLMANYADQVNLKDGYYNLFGVKMIFAVIAFAISAYLMFGLRPTIENIDLTPEKRKNLPIALKKISTFGRMNLWTVTLTIFLGVWLARF
ncbi:MAG: DUF4149 domain-containing protein [Nitrospinales bacterium]